MKFDAQLRQAIREGQDPAHCAQHQGGVERVRGPDHHLESLRSSRNDFADALDVPGTLFDPDNIRMFGKPRDELGFKSHAGKLRNGVQHHGKLGGIGYAPVMLDEGIRS